MKNYLDSHIGRLRLLALLEGVSLLVLVFVGVPLKYWMHSEMLVKVVGPIHGFLFVAFVILALVVATREKGRFLEISIQLIVASFIPFGTFYVDAKILKPIHLRQLEASQSGPRNP